MLLLLLLHYLFAGKVAGKGQSRCTCWFNEYNFVFVLKVLLASTWVGLVWFMWYSWGGSWIFVLYDAVGYAWRLYLGVRVKDGCTCVIVVVVVVVVIFARLFVLFYPVFFLFSFSSFSFFCLCSFLVFFLFVVLVFVFCFCNFFLVSVVIMILKPISHVHGLVLISSGKLTYTLLDRSRRDA